MRTRIIAGVVAVVLAIAGTVMLLSYANGANSRALAGTQPVTVLVLSQPVPKNTAGKDLVGMVTTKAIPSVAVLPGRVTSLDQLAGKVATVDLVPGEQLLASRFADPATAAAQNKTVPNLPPGMQEVTIQLDPQRAVGGQLTTGDTVGIFISMGTPPTTHLTLQKVQITSVQGASTAVANTASTTATKPAAAGGATTAAAAPPVPTGSLLVTLAVTAPMAEHVVFAAEHASIWLSKEPASATTDDTTIITPESVFK